MTVFTDWKSRGTRYNLRRNSKSHTYCSSIKFCLNLVIKAYREQFEKMFTLRIVPLFLKATWSFKNMNVTLNYKIKNNNTQNTVLWLNRSELIQFVFMAKGQPRNWPLRNKSGCSVAFCSQAREFDWGRACWCRKRRRFPWERSSFKVLLSPGVPHVLLFAPPHAPHIRRQSCCTPYVIYLETDCRLFKKHVNVIWLVLFSQLVDLICRSLKSLSLPERDGSCD